MMETRLQLVQASPGGAPPLRYTLRMSDALKIQNAIIPFCIVTRDSKAHLYQIYVENNQAVFPGAHVWSDEIEGIMVGGDPPSSSSGKVELEIEGQANRVFLPYFGDMETSCLYVPRKDPDADVIEAGIREYSKRKADTLRFLLGIIGIGAITCQELHGTDSAVAFASGGMLGVMYQMLLHYEIDKMGSHQLLVNTATRIGAVVLGGAVMSQVLHIADPSSFFMASTLGFLMQKLALWLSFTI